MNTGFLGPAVATVLTVYGIETFLWILFSWFYFKLQQYLPFTVLKQIDRVMTMIRETSCNSTYRLRY